VIAMMFPPSKHRHMLEIKTSKKIPKTDQSTGTSHLISAYYMHAVLHSANGKIIGECYISGITYWCMRQSQVGKNFES